MTKFRPIEGKDREAVRSVIEGTGAFKPHEVDVAMELVDESLAQPGQDDYHPIVLEEEDGTVVAYACFGKNPMTKATFDLYWLATRADRMGKGYDRGCPRLQGELGAVPRRLTAELDRLHSNFPRDQAPQQEPPDPERRAAFRAEVVHPRRTCLACRKERDFRF
jgi:hypothetical protein